MKCLCLHGSGTNSAIFQTQTAALRYELGDELECEFVEGVLEAPPAQELDLFLTPNDNFFAYYDPMNLDTLEVAIDQLDEYVDAEGPFDILMGFSAGAVLAAAYLLTKSASTISGNMTSFKGAIFFACDSSENPFRHLGLQQHTQMINIPTLHIWGTNDLVAPTGGITLRDWCNPRTRSVVIHPGGHEVIEKTMLKPAAQATRRLLYLASHGGTDDCLSNAVAR